MKEAMLKEELRNMERMKKREGVDMTYLKNVILKLLETGRYICTRLKSLSWKFGWFLLCSIDIIFKSRWYLFLTQMNLFKQEKWRLCYQLLECFFNLVVRRWSSLSSNLHYHENLELILLRCLLHMFEWNLEIGVS